MGMGRKMEWAGHAKHMVGIPRKLVFMAVGGFSKAVATLLNSTSVHNADTLIRLVRSRPPGLPLLTVSNHMSTYIYIYFSSLLCCAFYFFISYYTIN
jgi:monolysocardiolipin acyltransferase